MAEPVDIEERVRSVLDGTGVPYEVIDIDPDYADTAAFCEKYGYPIDTSGNTIVVASRREPVQYAACVVKASTQLDVNRTVRKLMGVRRLSFASPEQTMEVTGMMIGGVTAFALPPELPLYVDDKLMALEYVILGSGSRSSKINVSPQVLETLPNAQVIAGLSLEPRAQA